MKDSPGLHLKTYVLIFFIVLFAPLGNVLLSKGMKRVGSAKNWLPGDIFHVLANIITSGYIWLGIACLLMFFVAYMLVLTWADYSYVQPASSFSYAVVAMLGYFLLEEHEAGMGIAGASKRNCSRIRIAGQPPFATRQLLGLATEGSASF